MPVSSELKRFNHLITEIDAAYHECSLKLGLSDSAMSILYTLCNYGEECLLSDITAMSGINKQTINSALRKLEKEGILYLEPCGRKKKKVCLTTSGKLLTENTVSKLINIENEIYHSWSESERNAHLSLTQKYLSAFQEKIKELK